MMILNLSRNVLHANNMVKSNLFHKKKSLTNIYEVYKKNILILGFGRVGKELQKRCQSFGMNILVYDPYVLEKDILALGCKKVDFDEKSNDAIIDFLECIIDYAPADIDLEEEPDPIYEEDEE